MVPAAMDTMKRMDRMRRGCPSELRAGGALRRAHSVRWWSLVAAAVLLAGGVAHASDKQQKPWLQLQMEDLGIPPVSQTFLAAGSSSLTLNFLDDSHLLVTFGTRALVPRIAGDPEDDDDRMVGAEILELPTGKVLARTDWHMHDHGRYLWSLGRGRFLVRIADRMYTMAPLANMATKDPFARALLPNRPMKPSAVFVSSDGGLLTLETVVPIPGQQKPTVAFGDQDKATVLTPKTRTLIDFFRLGDAVMPEGKSAEGAEAMVQSEAAGNVISPLPLQLPTDADGYLWADDSGGGRWAVSFNPYQDKAANLGSMMSSCYPRLQMVSRSEFVALTCMGSDDKLKLASYGLDGTETWEETFGDVDSPSFAYAPGASRFAFSRVLAGPTGGDMMPSNGANVGGAQRQEVRVYQDASGDMLLKVSCSPAFKTGENFDLSADGLLFAAVQNGAITVYKLPPLGKKDVEDIAEVAKFAPPAGLGAVKLARLTGGGERETRKRLPGVGPPAGTVAGSAVGMAASGAVSGGAGGIAPDAGSGTADPVGEGQTTGGRKAPTLLKPGEKPEFKTKNLPVPGGE
jgi:hypothetical protein